MPQTTTRNPLNGRRWQLTRAAIRKRDGHRCQGCGTDQRLAVHHIIPRRLRPDLTYEHANLITLCAACHNAIEPRADRKSGKETARKRKEARKAPRARRASKKVATSRRFFDTPDAHPRPHGISLPGVEEPGGRLQSRIW